MTRRPRRSARRLWWEFRMNFRDLNDWLAWQEPWWAVWVEFYDTVKDLGRRPA